MLLNNRNSNSKIHASIPIQYLFILEYINQKNDFSHLNRDLFYVYSYSARQCVQYSPSRQGEVLPVV